jgi:hypothetical protein
MFLFSILLCAADCDNPKPDEKDGGCKIGEVQSDDFITCLINAKNDEETAMCNQIENARKQKEKEKKSIK